MKFIFDRESLVMIEANRRFEVANGVCALNSAP